MKSVLLRVFAWLMPWLLWTQVITAQPFAYECNYRGSTVTVIDVATNTVLSSIPVPGVVPGGIAITSDDTKAYVTDINGDAVTILDLTTNTVTGTIPVGHESIGVAFSPDNSRAYVCNTHDNTVTVINALTNTVIGSPID